MAVTGAKPAVVDAHLARLDAAARRAFVADVWAARGFETAVDGDVVVAERHGDSVVLLPLRPSRLGRPPSPSRPIDVVVAFDGDRDATGIAAEHGARVVTAAEFRQMLRYALAPADADDLCRRHLGAPASALPTPLSVRLGDRVGSRPAGSVGATTAVALLAVIVFTLAGGAALSDTTSAGPPLDAFGAPAAVGGTGSTAPGSTPVDAPTAATSTPTPRVGSIEGVSGVGPEGITDLSALAAAHDRALGDRSYTLWTDRYRPQNGVPGATRTQRDTDIAVDGDRYLVEETFETGDERRLTRVVYFDGADWYVDDRSTETASVRWINGEGATTVAPDPRTLRETLVERYLATPTTAVTERIQVGRQTRYRLEGDGRPPAFDPETVYNYSFVAFVDEDGLVHEATVDFTVVTVEGSYRLRFEWTYGAFDATTVTEPAWLHLANPAVETTSTPAPETNRSTETAS